MGHNFMVQGINSRPLRGVTIMDGPRLRHKGRIINEDELVRTLGARHPIRHFAIGTEGRRENVVDAFESDDEFNEWVREQGFEDRAQEIREAVRKSKRDQENRDHSDLIERHVEEVHRTRDALRRLSEKTGLALNSPELFRRAHEGQAGEERIFRTFLLYEHVNYGGAAVPVLLTWPDFRWLGFNDRCSSLHWAGAGVLCEHIWYGGQWFWLFGIGSLPWIGHWWNDRASSAITI
jgi:hypothetical protein